LSKRKDKLTKEDYEKMYAFANKYLESVSKLLPNLNLSYKKRLSQAIVYKDILFSYEIYHKKNPEGTYIYIYCCPSDKSYSCRISHYQGYLEFIDSFFSLNQYLEVKGEKNWYELYDLESKSFYEGFPLFFNTVVRVISQYKELQDLLTGVKPWRNPVFDASLKIDLKKYHEFLNERLIPGPQFFQKIGLVYKKQNLVKEKSEITDYIKHSWHYYHEHKKSKYFVNTIFRPEQCFINAYVEKPEIYNQFDFINFRNYLEFKTKSSLDDNVSEKIENDPYKYFKYFMKVLEDAILNKGLGDIIKGKWENIPNPYLDYY